MIAYKVSKNAKILFVGINPHPGSYRRGVPFSNNKMFWYWSEIDAHLGALEPILDAQRKGVVTLLFSSHDSVHNNVVALKTYLEAMKKSGLKGNVRRRAVAG